MNISTFKISPTASLEEITVQLNAPFVPEITARLLKTIVKFILLLRGQIPCSWEQLQSIVELERERQNLQHFKRKYKKANDLLQSGEALFEDLEKICHCLRDWETDNIRFLLLIGTTITTPKAIYIINLPTIVSSEAGSNSKAFNACERKLVRSLVQSLSDEAILRPTRTFLLVETTRNHPLDFLVPKQTFNFHKLKGRACSIKLENDCIINESEANEIISLHSDESVIEMDQDIPEKHLLWFQSKNILPGLNAIN
ncbi:regulation of exit from mitosis [Basidiobolus ranarum]|uniref:Regulation of exit from mitosis n=1 Tax=Basidiobolus ranarum TaxID=34480 RepID=A0ABR2X458_9FUNG